MKKLFKTGCAAFLMIFLAAGYGFAAPKLVSITVSPANSSIPLGLKQQFTATGTYSNKSTEDITSMVAWSSSQPGIATISAAGLATSIGTGSATITATSKDVSGSTTFTVTPAILTSLAVTPTDPSIALGQTWQFTATGTYTDSSTKDLTSSVAWMSTNQAVATITRQGLAASVAAGSTTITATSEAIVAATTMTARNVLLESPFGFHPAGVAKQGYAGSGFGDAQNIGVKWTRQGVYAFWFLVQPDLTRQEYDFSLYDRQWSAVPAGMRILANIAPQGPIDEGYCLPGSYLPIDVQKYISFVKAMVDRYDGDGGAEDMRGLVNPIKYWQVGNEPNAIKKGFADLQRITYIAIKEACPDCQVLIGGVPGMPPADVYISNFDQQYKPILDALGGKYLDIMDFHWYGGATGDYKGAKEVYDHILSVLNADGFPAGLPIWITEMGAYSGDPLPTGPLGGGVDFPAQTERQQALDYFKRFVQPLSFGVKKIFPAFGLMEGFKYEGGYFDYTGLIYDGWDLAGGTPYDLGLGVKKLGYYTYKKMTEALEGSDWNSIQPVREDGDVYIYKIMKNGKPVYAAWWNYFNDPAYMPGKTIQVSLSGLQGATAVITSVVPKFATGAEVKDYAEAFKTGTAVASNGSVTFDLGESPVIVELPPLLPLKKVVLTTDAEGGSARPEIIATRDRVFAVYLGNVAAGADRTFNVKIYDAHLDTLIGTKTLVETTPQYGGPTDIRIASDGQYLYAFYETNKRTSLTTAETYLWARKYALNDGFDLVASTATPTASSKPMEELQDGGELLDDPAPLVGPNSVYVITRLKYSLSTAGSTIYRVREFSKDLYQLNQFDLDLTDIAAGRGRVTSLLFWNNNIYMALATTVSDQDINESNDDGALSDVVLVKMNPDWAFDPQTDVRAISAEPDDRENYITGLRTDGTHFYMSYKQATGIPPSGQQSAVIKMFDKNFNPVHKQIVRSVVWASGGGEIRPSLELFGSRLYSGQSAGQTLGTGNAEIRIFEIP